MYAKNTIVSPDRSQNEIKKILNKYGAKAFGIMESDFGAMVTFEMKDRRVAFRLPIKPKGNLSEKAHQQFVRTRWRALVLSIKAKLECVETGITSFDQEFLAHIVIPGGGVFGDTAIPAIDTATRTGNLPPLLGSSL